MNMAQWSDLPLVLTSEQVAAVLQLQRRTITTMLDRGDLHGIKVGKEWRVSRAELMRFVEGSPRTRSGVRARAKPGAEPMLVSKDGVLVVRAEPVEDLTDITRRERDRRVADLIQQAGL